MSGDGITSGGGGSAHASDDPLLALHTSRRGETVARCSWPLPSLSPVTLLSAEASAISGVATRATLSAAAAGLRRTWRW